MTKAELFAENCAGGYNNTATKVSWKIKNRVMYFEGSSGWQDWVKNVLGAIPWPMILAGRVVFVPFGAWLAWIEIEDIATRADVDCFSGYSHGGWIATIACLYRALPGVVFGCPNILFFPGSKTISALDSIEFVQTPGDIVADLPSFARKGDLVIILEGKVVRPDYVDEVIWATGHSPQEYMQRLASMGL